MRKDDLMVTKYIAVKKASGPFIAAIHPYKHWFEYVSISPLFEFKRKRYRIVSTKSLFNPTYLRKIVVTTENGKLVKDEASIKYVLLICTYLHMMRALRNEVRYEANLQKKMKLIDYKQGLLKIQDDMKSVLTDEENHCIENQLAFYDKVSSLLENLTLSARKWFAYMKELNELSAEDCLTEDYINELKEVITERQDNRAKFERLILKYNQQLNEAIKNFIEINKPFIEKSDYQKVQQGLICVDNVIDEVLSRLEEDFKLMHKELGERYKSGSLESYLHYLEEEKYIDIFSQVNLKILYKEHWALSKDCVY